MKVKGAVATYSFTPDTVVEPARRGTMEVDLEAATFTIVEPAEAASTADEARCARLCREIVREYAESGEPPGVVYYIA